MNAAVTLPLVFGILAYLLPTRFRSPWSRRERMLGAAAAMGIYLVLVTELLNAFRAVTAGWVGVSWAVGCAILLSGLALVRHTVHGTEPSGVPVKKDTWEVILLTLITGNTVVLAVIALIGVPNTYDSMTYHLARVAHWLQNHSVAVFATSCMYQNQHCPLAEWAMLHLVLLQGTDRWVNFVQWFSYVGSLIAVSLIAEICGGSRRAGIVAAFLAATIPMAVLQASTTQNDAVLGFWLLCLTYGCLKASREPSWAVISFCGASLGLALLTKTLGYLEAPPFCLWLAIVLWRRGPRFAIPRLALVILTMLLLNGGYYCRNWTSTGTLLGLNHDSGPGISYENEIHTPSAVAANILDNLSLETPQLPGVTDKVKSVVVTLDAWLGIKSSDQRIISYAHQYYLPPYPDETECASPVHLLLLLLSFGLLLLARRSFSTELQVVGAGLVIGAFLFCLVLKWQPYHSRFHLSFLLLGAPVIAVVFEKMKFRLLPLLALSIAYLGMLPMLLSSCTHPLLGRNNIFVTSPSFQRFTFQPSAEAEYEQVLQLIRQRHARVVGVIGLDSNTGWEYPLFDPDHMNGGYPWRVEQVGIRNLYAPLETSIVPDALVTLWPSDKESINLHGRTYHLVFRGYVLTFYLP